MPLLNFKKLAEKLNDIFDLYPASLLSQRSFTKNIIAGIDTVTYYIPSALKPANLQDNDYINHSREGNKSDLEIKFKKVYVEIGALEHSKQVAALIEHLGHLHTEIFKLKMIDFVYESKFILALSAAAKEICMALAEEPVFIKIVDDLKVILKKHKKSFEKSKIGGFSPSKEDQDNFEKTIMKLVEYRDDAAILEATEKGIINKGLIHSFKMPDFNEFNNGTDHHNKHLSQQVDVNPFFPWVFQPNAFLIYQITLKNDKYPSTRTKFNARKTEVLAEAKKITPGQSNEMKSSGTENPNPTQHIEPSKQDSKQTNSLPKTPVIDPLKGNNTNGGVETSHFSSSGLLSATTINQNTVPAFNLDRDSNDTELNNHDSEVNDESEENSIVNSEDSDTEYQLNITASVDEAHEEKAKSIQQFNKSSSLLFANPQLKSSNNNNTGTGATDTAPPTSENDNNIANLNSQTSTTLKPQAISTPQKTTEITPPPVPQAKPSNGNENKLFHETHKNKNKKKNKTQASNTAPSNMVMNH